MERNIHSRRFEKAANWQGALRLSIDSMSLSGFDVNHGRFSFVQTTTDYVGGAEKALAMKMTKKLLLV